MDKPGVRASVRRRRAAGHTATPDLPRRVLAVVPAGVVCCYVSLPAEPPTQAIIEALLTRGDDVYLPVAGPAGLLHWVRATDTRPWDTWGVAGRPAPGVPTMDLPTSDCIIVPALAVDRDGHRLGQGGGYYDRLLPTQPQARIIALVWSDEVLDTIPSEPHDVRVDNWVIADE